MIERKFVDGKLRLFDDGIILPFTVTKFMGFDVDITSAVLAIENRRKKEQVIRRRRFHHHRSRGLPISKFKLELKDALKDCVDQDWVYNGEDEYPVDNFNFDKAVNSILELMVAKGLIKYL